MIVTIELLKEALVDPGHITKKAFESAYTFSESKKKDFQDVLVEKGLISEDNLNRVIAEIIGVDFVNLSQEVVNEKIFKKVPEFIAKNQEVIAFRRKKDSIDIGMRNPNDIETKHFLEKRFGKIVNVYLISKSDFRDALSRYTSDVKNEVEALLASVKSTRLSDEEKDSITIRLVDKLLVYGYQNKASDIHIEPYEADVLVRYRIDGVMHDVLDIPSDVYQLVLTRLKILAKIRTDEHQAAQDGKLRFKVDDEKIDVRISVVPVTKGEKIVMRILSASSRNYTLTDLGLSDQDYEKVLEAIAHPHGMILVTGPTGSGKTTTLYATLKILNKPEVNVTTIEDPVEYDMPGVNQIQVNTRTELTFAKGLRAIVRQDPDIIMIGEIRDNETASIAVNAALTGHLVLSTLHTNDASSTFPRLLDMSVEPFLVASTVNVVIAQRLVREICKNCRVSFTMTPKQKEALKKQLKYVRAGDILQKKSTTLYHGEGCEVCNNTGYRGRVGIFEVLLISDEMKELIMNSESSDVIKKQAVADGMKLMIEDGIDKVVNGITTMEEVLRVTRD